MQVATQLSNLQPASTPGRRKPWRILFIITSSDVGGAETILRELVLRLDPFEFEPLVCTLRPCGQVADDIAAAGIRVLTLDMSEQPRIAELATGVVRLARWIDEFRVDLVQSFLYRANAVAGVAARLAHRRPIVIGGQHSLYPLGGRRAALAGRLTWRLSDRVVACSAAVRAKLLETERFESQRIVLIANGVDTTRYKTGVRSAVGDRFGFDRETILIGGVGRLSAEKAFHHLIEGIALGRQEGFPLGLVLAGDGPERPKLEARAHALGCDGQVNFLGMRQDLRPVYAAVDIFALASLHEASPNALLEAMACGRAVVATRVGGSREIVEDERSGLLVAPGSPRALADALVRLAADPVLRQRLGQEAARRVRNHFDVTRMLRRYSQLYRGLLLSRAHSSEGRS